MEIVPFGHGLNAAEVAARHDFVFAAAAPTMRNSRNSISGFHADGIAQIALIPRFFDFTWNGH